MPDPVLITRHIYRRWDGAEALDLETLTGAVYHVPPAAWVRTDLLTGCPTAIREGFHPKALKAKHLPVPDPAEVDGLPVVVPEAPVPHIGRGYVAGAPRTVQVPSRLCLMAHSEAQAAAAQAAAHFGFALTWVVPDDAMPLDTTDGWLAQAGVTDPAVDTLVTLTPDFEPTPGWLRRAMECREPLARVTRSKAAADAAQRKIGVVVTVYNRADVALPCLRQLHEATRGAGCYPRVIIIDDASEPHVSKRVQALLDDLWPDGATYERFERNRGYREAANRGAEIALSQGCDGILFLNSDVLVGHGALDAMARAMTAGADLVNPHCNDAALISLPLANHKTLAGWRRLAGGRSYQEINAVLRCIPPTYPEAVTSVGNCMLVSATAWRTHGPFDPVYGRGYGEECELWAKVLEGGGRAVVADDCYVFHESHATHGHVASAAEKRGVELFRRRHERTWAAHAHKMSEWPQRTAHTRAAVARMRPAGLPVHLLAVDLGSYGGAYCLVRLVAEMQRFGIQASVGHLHEQQLAVVPPFGTVRHASEGQLAEQFSQRVGTGGILVATHWSTVQLTQRVVQRWPGWVQMAFWQDREDLFTDESGQHTLPAGMRDAYTAIPHRVFNAPWVFDSAETELGTARTPTTAWVPVGVDCDLFHPRAERTPGPVRVLAMWRPHTPRRGAHRIRQVYDLIRKARPDVSLELFGWGDGVPAGIVDHGKLTQRGVADLMAQVDIVLEASDYQGFGLPGAEAMASGAVLVSADTRGVHAYADDTCAVITSHDPGEMARAVLALVDDPERRAELAVAGRCRIEAIDWPIIGALWARYLCDLWLTHGDDRSFDNAALDAKRQADEYLKERGR